MKRYLALLLMVIMVVGLLAGCGSADKEVTGAADDGSSGAEQSEGPGGEAEADPSEAGTGGDIPEEYARLADELVSRYENYQNFGIGCRLDVDWDIEGEEIIALLPEGKRDLAAMPVKAVQCSTYEEALEQTYRYIDESLMDKEILDFTAGLYVYHNDELYFFWGNKGLVTYQDTAVEEVTDNGMVVVSDLYSSGGELYETDRFTIEKADDHFKIVGMEIVEEYWG